MSDRCGVPTSTSGLHCMLKKGHGGEHDFRITPDERTYTEAEHQAEVAAWVRKAAENCRRILARQWREDAAGNLVLMEENGNIADLDIGPVEAILSMLTPPMTSALAEHEAKVRAEALSDNKMPCGHLRAELCTIRVGQGPGTGKQYCAGCERESELKAALAKAQKQAKFYLGACSKQNYEVCQTLGKVLRYPWFKDDQKNFPGSTDADGICEGEHVAETIASEAASKITALQGALAASEGRNSSLIKVHEGEIANLEAELAEARKDKNDVYIDYQDVVKRLNEADAQITALQKALRELRDAVGGTRSIYPPNPQYPAARIRLDAAIAAATALLEGK